MRFKLNSMTAQALAMVALGAHTTAAFQPLFLSLRAPGAAAQRPSLQAAHARLRPVAADIRMQAKTESTAHDFSAVPWADLSHENVGRAAGHNFRHEDFPAVPWADLSEEEVAKQESMIAALLAMATTNMAGRAAGLNFRHEDFPAVPWADLSEEEVAEQEGMINAMLEMAATNMAESYEHMVQPVADTMAETIATAAETIDNIGEYTPDPSKKDSRLALLGVAALSGSGYAAVRVLGDSLDSSAILAIRFVIAAMVLSPWIRKLDKQVLGVALETGGWLTIGYIAQAVCLQTSTAGAAAFLASLTTVVCPVIERLTGKRLDKKAWTAMVLAVMGAFALEFGGGEMPKSNDLIGLLQPLLFGVYLFKTERALDKFPDQGLPITAVQTAVCATGSVCWYGFNQQLGVTPETTTEVLAQTGPSLDAASALLRPAIDLLAQTQSADDAALILSAIKTAPSAVPTLVDHAQSMPTVLSEQMMQTVDVMMQPVAEISNSIEAVNGVVADGVAESKLQIPDGVSNALWQAKMWTYAPKVFALAWLGVLSSAAVLAVESIAVGKLSSSEAAVVFSTEPLWAAAVGAICIGEHVGTNTFVGGALVVAACISRVASPAELSVMSKKAMEDARIKIEAYKLANK